jgi:chromosome segregation ATPase
MLDLALKYELVLLAGLALMIAWFMGRSLCRSKEYQIKTELKQQQHESKRLEQLLLKKDQEIAEQYEEIKKVQKSLIEKSNDFNHSESNYKSLEKTHQDTITKLQNYETNKVKLSTLSQQYDEQAIELINLKKMQHETSVDLQQCRITLNEQKHTLEKHKVDYKQLNQENNENIKKIAQLTKNIEILENQLFNQQQAHQVLQTNFNKLQNNYEELEDNYQAKKKEALTLKHSWQETQHELNDCNKALAQQKTRCENLQSKNKTLSEELQAYEILSTIR